MNTKHKKLLVLSTLVLILAGTTLYFGLFRAETERPSAEKTEEFDKSTFPIDDPSSLWVVVNKQRPLPQNYAPSELVVPSIPLYGPDDAENMHVDARLIDDLENLVKDAEEEGLRLALGSAYRSASYQSGIYNLYVEREGQEAADNFSARPGHSEHQTGLAVDFVLPSGECFIERCFEDTAEGKWLRDNAHKYGFILRYQENTRAITGYEYEPWHFRYVGRDLAREIHNSNNPTLEEFFDLEPAVDY